MWVALNDVMIKELKFQLGEKNVATKQTKISTSNYLYLMNVSKTIENQSDMLYNTICKNTLTHKSVKA